MQLLTTIIKASGAVALSLSLLSCSGSGSGAAGPNDTPSNNATTSAQLADALIRKTGDAEAVTDLWRCLDEDYAISHLAVGDFGGVQESLSFSINASLEEKNVVYDWKTVGSDGPFATAPHSSGRYRIDGYAHRLQFNNGFQVKVPFAWFNRADQKANIINHYPTLSSN